MVDLHPYAIFSNALISDSLCDWVFRVDCNTHKRGIPRQRNLQQTDLNSSSKCVMVSADGLTKDGQFNANHIVANLNES